MTLRQRLGKLILSTLIAGLAIGAASMGGCSSEVGSAPSGKEAARAILTKDEDPSEGGTAKGKGKNSAAEKKSIKGRVLGAGGEK